MKTNKYFFAIIIAAVMIAGVSCTDAFLGKSWLYDKENYTLSYIVNGDTIDVYELNLFELIETENLFFRDTIMMDQSFASTQGFLKYKKIEQIASWNWSDDIEIRRFKYQGKYEYAICNIMGTPEFYKVAFEFTGEEAFSEKDNRLLFNTPSLTINKAGDTVKEYIDPKTGEYEHVLLKIPLAVKNASNGKKLSDLPIVFDIVRLEKYDSIISPDDVVVLSSTKANNDATGIFYEF